MSKNKITFEGMEGNRILKSNFIQRLNKEFEKFALEYNVDDIKYIIIDKNVEKRDIINELKHRYPSENIEHIDIISVENFMNDL
jgi:hypothetical protein